MKSTENKKLVAVIFLLAVLLLLLMLTGAFLWIREKREQLQLQDQLDVVQTEMAIEHFARDMRESARESALSAEEQEQVNRRQIMASMLEKDRQDLLVLVNPWNPVPENLNARLINIGKTDAGGNPVMLDERAAAALKQMLKDCINAGLAPVPLSAYRTKEYQQELFDNKVERLIAEMQTPYELLEETAAREVARPGTSEHQTGLAVDIVDEFYPSLDSTQEWMDTQRWLMKNCTDYGFILRYPNGTSEVTGIVYEPWHYRYVGKSVAREIAARGITLEEYLESNQ